MVVGLAILSPMMAKRVLVSGNLLRSYLCLLSLPIKTFSKESDLKKNLKSDLFYFKYLSCLFPIIFVSLCFVMLSDGTANITFFSAQYVVKQSSHNSLKAVEN